MSWKPTLVISCPASSRSGYGDHARDIINSILKMDKFNVQILDQRWGDCPQTELDNYPKLKSLVISQLTQKPDVWVQVTVPNEFQPVGNYNIGITAGIETDRCAPQWLEGLNRMDLNIVPSKHSKDVFENSSYRGKNPQGQEVELKLQKPVEVVFEGLDLETYFKTSESDAEVDKLMANVDSDFCFLFVGHWLSGGFGHDRKDIATLIKAFHETFENKSKKNQPALVLKTGMSGFSRVDEHNLIEKIQKLVPINGPEIKILHGDLTPGQMNALYNHKKIKAMVSFTKGEGFGRPLLEFGATGKPILASNWSGHVDFLKNAILLPGQIMDVHKSAQWKDVIVEGSKWFYIDYITAKNYLKIVHKDYKVFCETSRKQPLHIKNNFSIEKADGLYSELLTKYIPEIPEPIQLKLPKLEKIS